MCNVYMNRQFISLYYTNNTEFNSQISRFLNSFRILLPDEIPSVFTIFVDLELMTYDLYRLMNLFECYISMTNNNNSIVQSTLTSWALKELLFGCLMFEIEKLTSSQSIKLSFGLLKRSR